MFRQAKTKNYFLILFFLLASISKNNAQETDVNKIKIADAFVNYFSLERENIHLHLNKNIYLSNEEIWFKGYVLNRKESLPFYYSTNIIVGLYDSEGTLLDQKLVFGDNGNFYNNFKLTDKYISGDYYIRAHTNWMNNFSEDESAVFKLTIINSDEKNVNQYINQKYNDYNISIIPEGGKIIRNIKNPVVVRITDCKNSPIEIEKCELTHVQSGKSETISLNQHGYGKFYFNPDGGNYQISFELNSKKYEKNLPSFYETGITLEVNNYAVSNKTMVTVKTNNKTLPSLLGRKFYLAINQDNQVSVIDFIFEKNKEELTIIIPKEKLYKGLNNLTIIDDELKEICQRSIFVNPVIDDEIRLMKYNIASDKIKIVGKSSLKNANLSISILPVKTKSLNHNTDLYSTFYANDRLSDKIRELKEYLLNPSKEKNYQLDIALIHQKNPKYTWNNILQNVPQIKYDFNIGLDVKGKINTDVMDYRKYKLKMFSAIYRISEFSDLNENNEFSFKHLFVLDSSRIDFQLFKVPDFSKPIESNKYITSLSNRNFRHKLTIENNDCKRISFEDPQEYELPNIYKNIIHLDEVEIENNLKPVLKHGSKFGNSNLRGEKIPDDYRGDLVRYLNLHGFNAFVAQGDLHIYGKHSNTMTGNLQSPAIFVDDFKLMTFNDLQSYKMQEIDEIYLNAHAVVPGMQNYSGIIKIYRKHVITSSKKEQLLYSSYFVQNGFSKSSQYQAPQYLSFSNKGFENFGVYDWNPNVLTDDEGNFEFYFNNPGVNDVILNIEGMSFEGEIISINKEFNLN